MENQLIEKKFDKIAEVLFGKYFLVNEPICLSKEYFDSLFSTLLGLEIELKMIKAFIKTIVYEKLEEVLKSVEIPVNQKFGMCMRCDDVLRLKRILVIDYLSKFYRGEESKSLISFIQACISLGIDKNDAWEFSSTFAPSEKKL